MCNRVLFSESWVFFTPGERHGENGDGRERSPASDQEDAAESAKRGGGGREKRSGQTFLSAAEVRTVPQLALCD